MRSEIGGDTNMVSTDPPVYKYPLSPGAIHNDSSLLVSGFSEFNYRDKHLKQILEEEGSH